MTVAEAIEAPGHLSPKMREWYAAVVSVFELDEHHLLLLTLAGEAWDEAKEARKVLAMKELSPLPKPPPKPAPPPKPKKKTVKLPEIELEPDVDAE